MTKAIDNVVAHFDAQEIKKIEVKEWGTDGEPLEIFTKPLTLQESKKLYKMANGGDLEVMVYAIITKSLDADGNKLFTLADKESLMTKADVEVLSNVASEILGSVTSETAQEK
jgi:hypothetical protein